MPTKILLVSPTSFRDRLRVARNMRADCLREVEKTLVAMKRDGLIVGFVPMGRVDGFRPADFCVTVTDAGVRKVVPLYIRNYPGVARGDRCLVYVEMIETDGELREKIWEVIEEGLTAT